MAETRSKVKLHEKAFIHIRYETLGWIALLALTFFLSKWMFWRIQDLNAVDFGDTDGGLVMEWANRGLNTMKSLAGIGLAFFTYWSVFFTCQIVESFIRNGKRKPMDMMLALSLLISFFVVNGVLVFAFTLSLFNTIFAIGCVFIIMFFWALACWNL